MPTSSDLGSVRAVLDFWFSAEVEARWFSPDAAFDRDVTQRFGDLYDLAYRGELANWMRQAESALALVILLDQVPRNMFRGSPKAFLTDEQAREVSEAAISHHFDQQRSPKERAFFYLPLMHSEDLLDQTECVTLYRRLATDTEGLESAILHRDIIARFGRFPHRNKVLGRESNEEEADFLNTRKGF
jgi:uncharacterized protein (DUF924 family)